MEAEGVNRGTCLMAPSISFQSSQRVGMGASKGRGQHSFCRLAQGSFKERKSGKSQGRLEALSILYDFKDGSLLKTATSKNEMNTCLPASVQDLPSLCCG